MKKFLKHIILLMTLVIVLVLGFAYWNSNKASFESPVGIYVRDINNQDTIKLYENGVFEQVVYFNGQCLFNNSSEWEYSVSGIIINSILFYDAIHLKYHEEHDISSNETSLNGLQREYRDGKYCLVWYDFPDVPEKDVYIWYRVNSEP